MIRIGTAGYSYADWVGPYYPPGTRGKDMLAHYAREFSFVELNFSYYRMPDRRLLGNMRDSTPPGFQFAVKAHQSITHQEGDIAAGCREFAAALAPLAEDGRLACVLAQFPYAFRCTPANRERLQGLRAGMGELPVVVEFRNQEWISEETIALLRQEQLGFACVDEPGLHGLVRPVAASTAPVAYTRFHGRNAAKWWQHKESYERYNYLYSEDELREWLPRIDFIIAGADALYISFNNHYQGQAVRNSRMMRALLSSYKEGTFSSDVE